MKRSGRIDLIINYDAEADALIFKVRDGALADEELLDNNVVLGYDVDGKVVSVEVLDASKRGLLNMLMELAKARKDAAKLMLSKIG